MAEITDSYDAGASWAVTLPDGGVIRFRKVPEDFDPGDRDRVYAYLRERQGKGEIPTGLLYLKPDAPDHHDVLETAATPLVDLPFEELCPGAEALEEVLTGFR